jgi:hypothetical protein
MNKPQEEGNIIQKKQIGGSPITKQIKKVRARIDRWGLSHRVLRSAHK